MWLNASRAQVRRRHWVRLIFDLPSVCEARVLPRKHPEAIKEAVASLAGTATRKKKGRGGFDTGFDYWPTQKKRGAALRWISRLNPITLITGIETERESYPPNRASGHLFSSPHLTCFALARARSGPDARDEGLTGETTVSGNARLAEKGAHAAAPKIRVSDLVRQIMAGGLWALNKRRARVCPRAA